MLYCYSSTSIWLSWAVWLGASIVAIRWWSWLWCQWFASTYSIYWWVHWQQPDHQNVLGGGQRTGGKGKVWPVEVCNKLFKSPTSWFQASTTCLHYTQGGVWCFNVGCDWWTRCGSITICIHMLQHSQASHIQESKHIEREVAVCHQIQYRLWTLMTLFLYPGSY